MSTSSDILYSPWTLSDAETTRVIQTILSSGSFSMYLPCDVQLAVRRNHPIQPGLGTDPALARSLKGQVFDWAIVAQAVDGPCITLAGLRMDESFTDADFDAFDKWKVRGNGFETTVGKDGKPAYALYNARSDIIAADDPRTRLLTLMTEGTTYADAVGVRVVVSNRHRWILLNASGDHNSIASSYGHRANGEPVSGGLLQMNPLSVLLNITRKEVTSGSIPTRLAAAGAASLLVGN